VTSITPPTAYQYLEAPESGCIGGRDPRKPAYPDPPILCTVRLKDPPTVGDWKKSYLSPYPVNLIASRQFLAVSKSITQGGNQLPPGKSDEPRNRDYLLVQLVQMESLISILLYLLRKIFDQIPGLIIQGEMQQGGPNVSV